MKNKYLLYTATSIAAAVAMGAIAVSSVSASTTMQHSNFMSGMVNAIAQKFNLNPTDVQKVFDEQKVQMKTQMGAQMQQQFTDKINKAVTDGKLTQAQANLIIAKKAELDTQRAANETAFTGKTKAEIQALMKAQMDSLKQWATDNNIPSGYLQFGGFGQARGHFGPMMGNKK